MGKGEGSGEGWGEGEGKGQGNGGTWKGDLCGSCDCGLKCKNENTFLYIPKWKHFKNHPYNLKWTLKNSSVRYVQIW